ncbi:MAG: hypothetical protein JO252_05450, partial [Planctomycetaceae bacterium]|nr:hypothetical protein [Planctomycetaceae bacterium]
MSSLDLSVSFPSQGVILLQSRSLFGDADHPTCQQFLERVFQAEEITNVTIRGGNAPQAELRYCSRTSTLRDVVKRVTSFLSQGAEFGAAAANGHANGLANGPINGHAKPNGHAGAHSDHAPHFGHAAPRAGAQVPQVAGAITARDRRGIVKYYRHDTVVTGWEVKAESRGRLHLKNPVLYRKNDLCQAIERELMSILGIDKYSTHSVWCTVKIDYDPRQLSKSQVLEILDSALAHAEHPTTLDKLDLHLPLCT